MSGKNVQEEDKIEEVPTSPREAITDSVNSMSPSEAEALSVELHHMWDSCESNDENLVAELNRRFDEVCGDFPENRDTFSDTTVLVILHELYHWLANIKISKCEDEQRKSSGTEPTKKL